MPHDSPSCSAGATPAPASELPGLAVLTAWTRENAATQTTALLQETALPQNGNLLPDQQLEATFRPAGRHLCPS